MKQSGIFEVYEERGKRHSKLYTLNLAPGKKVYDEKLVREKGTEYREWDEWKSKLASCILKGCQNIHIKKGDVVLYLGAASGTTVSHISDIIGEQGFIFALDFAPRVVRGLVFVSEDRKNIAPILADANRPDKYTDKVSEVDVLYQDVAQKTQLMIFLKNCDLFLKKDGFALLAVKARSIDVTRKPKQLFNEVRRKLEEKMIIVDYKTLEPFQKDHCMFICKKKD